MLGKGGFVSIVSDCMVRRPALCIDLAVLGQRGDLLTHQRLRFLKFQGLPHRQPEQRSS